MGATDSAVPCAFMLDLSEALDPLLNERVERLEDGEEDDEDVAETTLQLVFFDGEEAFKDWTATDSIYGARYGGITESKYESCSFFFSILFLFVRHLAKKWETEYIPPHTKRRLIPGYSATEISTIEHLILLDLLGAPNPIVRNSFSDTAWLFDGMIDVERRLLEQGVFNSSDATSTQALQHSFFLSRDVPHLNLGGIEDDHIPFLRLGVSVLHIITNPFPRVWHKLSVRFHSFLDLWPSS